MAAGCFDPLSAKLAEKVGFKMLVVGGYPLALHLGLPEPLLTHTEVADAVRNISRGTRMPIVVDGASARDDLDGISRMVGELQRAGASGVLLDDRVHSTHNDGGKTIVSEEQMEEMIKVAKVSAGAEFVIGVESLAITAYGLDGCRRRSGIYAKAGASFCFFFTRSSQEVEMIPKISKIPLLHGNREAEGGRSPLLDRRRASDLGYKILVDSTSPLWSSYSGMKLAYTTFYETGRSNTGCNTPQLDVIRKEARNLAGYDTLISDRSLSRLVEAQAKGKTV